MYKKVENEKGLVRDTSSNAILNIDRTALNQSRKYRMKMKKKDDSIKELSDRLKKLEEYLGIN